MTVDITRSPFPVKYRELWLPRGIKGLTGPLPSCRHNGHGLAFTGVRRGTTCDGVHFTGAATSNINLGAIHNAAAKLYVSLRFKLDSDHDSSATVAKYIWGKRIDATHYLHAVLWPTDGKIYFEGDDGGVNNFSIGSTETSWTAGRWYNLIASISDVAAVRLIIENGAAITNASVLAAPNGGDVVIGDRDDPGALTGFIGTIADFFCEEGIDLTANQETDYYKGLPVATVDNAYPLDEGRGVTAYDRGADGNNGTLDTTATWAWGRVRQPVISFDSINDIAQTAAAVVDISRPLTVVWAGKIKSPYDTDITITDHYLWEFQVDANNFIQLWYNLIGGELRFMTRGSGDGAAIADLVYTFAIDDYAILICTVGATGRMRAYLDGFLNVEQVAGSGPMVGLATGYLGAEDSPSFFDPSKPLLAAIIEGEFTKEQVLAYSRFLDRIFNLGVVK